MLDWWGRDLRVLRRDRGRRHARHAGGVAALPGHGRQRVAGSEIRILDDDGQALPARHARHRVHGARRGGLRVPQGQGEDRRRTAATASSPSATSATSTTEGYLFLCDRKIDMIISGGVNIYPAEIESVLLDAPEGRRRRGVRHPARGLGREVKAVIEPAAGVAPEPGARRRDPRLLRRHARQVQDAEDRSTSSPRCRAIRTASSTSASCATRTGQAASGSRSERRRTAPASKRAVSRRRTK